MPTKVGIQEVFVSPALVRIQSNSKYELQLSIVRKHEKPRNS